jgi:hypothetical protein
MMPRRASLVALAAVLLLLALGQADARYVEGERRRVSRRAF